MSQLKGDLPEPYRSLDPPWAPTGLWTPYRSLVRLKLVLGERSGVAAADETEVKLTGSSDGGSADRVEQKQKTAARPWFIRHTRLGLSVQNTLRHRPAHSALNAARSHGLIPAIQTRRASLSPTCPGETCPGETCPGPGETTPSRTQSPTPRLKLRPVKSG